MRALTSPRVLAALAVMGGLAIVLLAPRLELPAPTEFAAPPAMPIQGPPPSSVEPQPVPEVPAAAKLRELRAMSETFRNTTFLIAIRDAGFVCRELLDVYGGVNNSTTWTASCSDMLAYTVGVAETGSLAIEPLLEQLDALPLTQPVEPGRREVRPDRR